MSAAVGALSWPSTFDPSALTQREVVLAGTTCRCGRPGAADPGTGTPSAGLGSAGGAGAWVAPWAGAWPWGAAGVCGIRPPRLPARPASPCPAPIADAIGPAPGSAPISPPAAALPSAPAAAPGRPPNIPPNGSTTAPGGGALNTPCGVGAGAGSGRPCGSIEALPPHRRDLVLELARQEVVPVHPGRVGEELLPGALAGLVHGLLEQVLLLGRRRVLP